MLCVLFSVFADMKSAEGMDAIKHSARALTELIILIILAPLAQSEVTVDPPPILVAGDASPFAAGAAVLPQPCGALPQHCTHQFTKR